MNNTLCVTPMNSPKIGIGITTRNRREIAAVTVSQWMAFLPEGAKLVIVDDASDRPFPNADFRFEQQAGIARAKNKCLELLEDCDHIFLSDDDCFPKKLGWEKPYIENSQPHLMFTFTHLADGRKNGRVKQGEYKDFQYFELPCGCLLYLDALCLRTVGGFDTDFVIWGYEHVEYSRRIHNAGLTEYPYCDVLDSERYWFSYDQKRAVVTSVPNRGEFLEINRRMFESKKHQRDFKHYK